ncbi:N-acetyltransferase [Leptolyngbya sp. 15MV]|nr:N-acetyltransferase [Leptolyngbya sp. 15MV]
MAVEGIEITHHESGGRGEYRATVPGSDAVSRLTWKARGEGVRVADHTLVPRELEGRGIAAALVDALVADAREQGFRIVPQCSYVEAKFRRNPDWAELRA